LYHIENGKYERLRTYWKNYLFSQWWSWVYCKIWMAFLQHYSITAKPAC